MNDEKELRLKSINFLIDGNSINRMYTSYQGNGTLKKKKKKNIYINVFSKNKVKQIMELFNFYTTLCLIPWDAIIKASRQN